MRAMNQTDVQLLVDAHRREPRQVTTVAVALAMLAYRRQIGVALRPTDLARALGISDRMARKAVQKAAALASDPEPHGTDERNLTVPEPQTKRNLEVPAEPQGSGTSRYRGAEPHGTENGTSRYRIKEKNLREGVCAFSHAGEGSDPEPIPNGPSPEPERREAVRFVADLTAGALEPWAAQACRVYPAAWVRALVERKAIGGPVPRAQLLNSILQAWARSGSCEYLDAPTFAPLAPTGTTGPRPPSAPYQSAADRRRAAQRAAIEAMEFPD